MRALLPTPCLPISRPVIMAAVASLNHGLLSNKHLPHPDPCHSIHQRGDSGVKPQIRRDCIIKRSGRTTRRRRSPTPRRSTTTWRSPAPRRPPTSTSETKRSNRTTKRRSSPTPNRPSTRVTTSFSVTPLCPSTHLMKRTWHCVRTRLPHAMLADIACCNTADHDGTGITELLRRQCRSTY